MATQIERLAAVETEIKGLRGEVGEMRKDTKTLLAAYNRQSGAAKLRAAIWTGLAGLSAAVGGVFMDRGH
jgi:hypothetical protein